MTGHFPGVREKPLDVAALDADVEEELRAICGDSFTRRAVPNSKVSPPCSKARKEPRHGKSLNSPKGKFGGVSSSAKASLTADAPGLDEIDFSELAKLLKTDQDRRKKRIPRK